MVIGPVSSEVAVEIALGLDGLARLLLDGVIGATTTHPRLTHLVGVDLTAAAAVGIVRPSWDRFDPDAAPGGGWTPVFSTHVEHQRGAQCLLEPASMNLCCYCLTAAILDTPLDVTEAELSGVAGLITAVSLIAPNAPIVSIPLDDLAQSLRRISDLDDHR